MKKFRVNVTMQRPGIFVYGGTRPLRDRTPGTRSSMRPVPGRFQRVDVYQNTSINSFCGTAFTDASGTLDNMTFSGGDRYPDEIRLVVSGDSLWGFRVGSNPAIPWGILERVDSWQWSTPWIDARESVVDVGLLRLGADDGSWNFLENDQSSASDDSRVNDFRAAALFEILDMVYDELDLSYLDSRWIVNDVVADVINSTQPWTYWNTVHMRDDLTTSRLLEAAPHEFGHVLYNLHHSDKVHYDQEATGYMHVHEQCSDFGSQFGHYEGYAEAFDNLFWRHHAQRVGEPVYHEAAGLCPTRGISREGNVDAFYSWAFGGEYLDRPPDAMHRWTTSLVGANEYSFPPTLKLLEIVSRTRTEDLNQLWSSAMGGMDDGSATGAPPYCRSRRFRCKVENELLLPGDPFPSEFKNVDCMPGRSDVVGWRVARDSIEVDFTAADFVDDYRIMTDLDGPVTWTEVESAEHGKAVLTQSVFAPNCTKVTLLIRSHNRYGDTDGAEVEILSDCRIEKPVITAVECTHFAAIKPGGPIVMAPRSVVDPDGSVVAADDEDGRLVEVPGLPERYRCDVSFTPSRGVDSHRYVRRKDGREVEVGQWVENSDGTFELWIKDWSGTQSIAVEAQMEEFGVAESSGFIPIDFPGGSPRTAGPGPAPTSIARRLFILGTAYV